MASVLLGGEGALRWSSCSRDALQKFLRSVIGKRLKLIMAKTRASYVGGKMTIEFSLGFECSVARLFALYHHFEVSLIHGYVVY